ncbi:MAG: hypothetical protein JXB45_00320 [Candidatus Krumholzibacteriota bacterium]|nr:hypothetical protein [Candidatus Krumholzibacteriota bacterium]
MVKRDPKLGHSLMLSLLAVLFVLLLLEMGLRIAFMGDSFTTGNGVAMDKTFPRLLESSLS